MPFNEDHRDIWDYLYQGSTFKDLHGGVLLYADAICVTTNGYVRKDGKAVMGRGVAKQAARLFPNVPESLGRRIQRNGNRVHVGLQDSPPHLVAFPVKHHFRDKADPELIRTSCQQLRTFVDAIGWKNVVMPRPGCGNGQLAWEDVRPILEEELDLRFTVVNNE